MSPDNSFTALLEKALLKNIAGCQRLISADRLSGGASQETWRLLIATASGEKQLAMRRAAGGEQVDPEPQHPGLAAEALLMQSARDAGVPEPQVHYVLAREDGLGDGFIMEWLEGEALGARIVRSPDFAEVRPQLALECGRILARIHAIDLDKTGLRQKLWEIPPADFVAQTWERYQLLETPQPMIDYTARWLQDHLPENYATTLVHNDFRNGNFMLSPQGVVAVLDWEVAHMGDPIRDLGWICTNSWRFGGKQPVGGFGDRADLFRGYEEVSGRPVDPEHVKFWEIFGSFWWAVGCLGMAEHYRNGPDQTVERPGIGRRSSECQVDCVNLLIPGPVDLAAEAPGSPDPDSSSPLLPSPLLSSPLLSSQDMPRADELLESVRDFLRQDLMAATSGRNNFLARVAANSLDIVLRELANGPRHQQLEHEGLTRLLGKDGSLMSLKWALVHRLRDGSMPLDDLALQQHLRQTVVGQVAIDQPSYSGYKRALGFDNES